MYFFEVNSFLKISSIEANLFIFSKKQRMPFLLDDLDLFLFLILEFKYSSSSML